jgi:hypothetical protein
MEKQACSFTEERTALGTLKKTKKGQKGNQF